MIQEIKNGSQVSVYQPSKEICDFTASVKEDYEIGYDIISKPWVELNDLSVVDRQSRDQRTFNAFVDESIEDPAQAWKWRGTRSKARNKAIAMHAQLTAGYIIPTFLAQNENDEEDRDFSDIMRDVVEWMVENSNYKSSFLVGAMGMLVNPVTYLGAEYALIYQKIKVKTEEGYTQREIIDEVLSGFQAPVYSATDILITNAHIQNIQRQRRILKREFIDISDVRAEVGEHENFEYVKPGVNCVFDANEGLFYEVHDDENPNLVEKVTVYDRRNDCEVSYYGGIYMGNVDDVEMNPMKHRDNRDAPKYNIVPFGYQRVNEHFFYYKSLMNAQYWDNQLLDAQYEVGMNRAFLDAEMPIAVYGQDKVDTDIVFPSAVVAFSDKETKAAPLLPQTDLSKLFAGMSMTERSIEESSVSGVSAGQLPEGDQKATAIAIAEQNAKTLIQGVGKSLAESIVQYGSLMADIALQHLTVPQIIELAGGETKEKYPSFILDNKNIGGKNLSKVIRFDDSLMGREMNPKKKRLKETSLAEEAGYPDVKKAIYLVNPELFSRMKYLTRVEPERMFPKNEAYMQAMMTQVYGQFAENPYISLEALTRKTLYPFFRGETDEIMKKQDEMVTNVLGGGDEYAPVDARAKGTSAGNMAVNKSLGKGMKSVV
jgi:hypothetical protein